MKEFFSRWVYRAREWEVFASTFLNYILHTDEGRSIRGDFVRQVIWKTILYFLFGIPVYVICYFLGWFPIDSPGRIFGFAFLAVDIAFGVALLRSLRTYRSRIQLFYSSHFAALDEEEDEDLPVGHREIPDASKLRRRIIHPSSAQPDLSALNLPEPEAVLEPEPTEMLPLHCRSCGRKVMLTAKVAQTASRCQYCGGELVLT